MTRIQLSDTVQDVIYTLSEGLPGAIRVLVETLQRAESIDPDNLLGSIGVFCFLDEYGIYGSRLWMLYKDVCGEDLVKTIAMIRACQLGIIGLDELNMAIDGQRNLDASMVLAQVQEQLPAFGVEHA
jgi:hypothetical protein